MNESSITISWEKNTDDSTDIWVSGDKDYLPYFSEAFLSVDTLPSVHSVDEMETSGESAGNSATASLLRIIIEIIRNSNKINGHIITEQKRNSKFPLKDLITIHKFAQIAGLKIDERKFRNRREFQMYFRELMKEYKGIKKMICQFILENLFASNQYDAFHTPHQRNSQKYFSSALERVNFPGTKFPGETFETQNMLVSRNGQSLFASNSYTQGPMPFQKANQVEKHCYFENAEIEHSNYQDTHAKHVLPCNFLEIRHQ